MVQRAYSTWMSSNQPEPVIPNNNGVLPSIDHKQDFYGAFGTYHPNNKQWVDLYWLFLDNSNKVTTQGITQDPTSVHTIGTRWTGEEKGFLWDFEPMGQVGQHGGRPIDSWPAASQRASATYAEKAPHDADVLGLLRLGLRQLPPRRRR